MTKVINKYKIIKGQKLKRCSQCNAFKNISDFPPDKRKSDGLDPRCRDCKTKATIKFYKTEIGREALKKESGKHRKKGYYNPEKHLPKDIQLIIKEPIDGHHITLESSPITLDCPRLEHKLYNFGESGNCPKHKFMCGEIIKQLYQES